MSVSAGEIAFAKELFAGLGPLTTRKMMGGLCLYSEGQIFAILSSEGQIYLKAKDAFADALEAEGCRKFDMGDGRTMGYWTLPDAALDDPDEAARWGRAALAAL